MERSTVRLFKALGDPTRMRILLLLGARELCLCEVTEVLGLSASTVSRHLSILRDAGLVLDRKDGRWVNFRLNTSPSSGPVRAQLVLLQRTLGKDDQVLADRKRLRSVDRVVICGRF
jgi:ArsR family transcriptional regulator